MESDDALLSELIAAGYGGGSPLATALYVGMAREHFLMRLREAAESRPA